MLRPNSSPPPSSSLITAVSHSHLTLLPPFAPHHNSYKESERMVSQDIQNNSFNFKYTYSVEIISVCKDDVVCLPRKLALSLAGVS